MATTVLVSAPATEPVTAAEAAPHAGIDPDLTEMMTLLSGKLITARQKAEAITRRRFVTQTWKLALPEFPCKPDCDGWYSIEIPNPPLQSVSSITYVDNDGATQTVSSSVYTVDALREPGRVVPAYGQSWPSARYQPNSVQVTFVCGYGAAASVPEGIKDFIYTFAHYLIHNRGDDTTPVPPFIERLLDPYLWGSYP